MPIGSLRSAQSTPGRVIRNAIGSDGVFPRAKDPSGRPLILALCQKTTRLETAWVGRIGGRRRAIRDVSRLCKIAPNTRRPGCSDRLTCDLAAFAPSTQCLSENLPTLRPSCLAEMGLAPTIPRSVPCSITDCPSAKGTRIEETRLVDESAQD